METAQSKFVDITILRRLPSGLFVNMTEFMLDDLGKCLSLYRIPEIKDRYCVTIFTDTKATYAAGVSFEEILKLAGWENTLTLRQMRTNVDRRMSDDLVVFSCAAKIIAYKRGDCIQEIRDRSGQIYYSFYRTFYVPSEETRTVSAKKMPTCVLTKKFYNLPVKAIDLNLSPEGIEYAKAQEETAPEQEA